jgi:hypothetical protein
MTSEAPRFDPVLSRTIRSRTRSTRRTEASKVAHRGGGFMELAQMTVEDIKGMDLEGLDEALPRLQEEAVRAEEALRVAQERIREDAGRRNPVPSFVEVHGDQLVVNIKTRDKKFRLLSSIRIPLAHVTGAEAETKVPWEVWRGWRVPGVNVPGVRVLRLLRSPGQDPRDLAAGRNLRTPHHGGRRPRRGRPDHKRSGRRADPLLTRTLPGAGRVSERNFSLGSG